MAGRMMGHSFLHGGPCLSGLSPAIVHVLLGGTPETCTVTLEDCPDLEIRDTIKLVCFSCHVTVHYSYFLLIYMLFFQLDGDSKLSEKDKKQIQDLAYAWDLPVLNESNRKWIFEKLLIHAVSGAFGLCFLLSLYQTVNIFSCPSIIGDWTSY